MCEPDDEPRRVQDLQRAVLGYLVEHREAKDTVHGIAQWWLPRAQAATRMTELTAALDDLVSRGWLTATCLGHGATVYGLDRGRLPEIRDFLEGG